jgi:hypothetical protein
MGEEKQKNALQFGERLFLFCGADSHMARPAPTNLPASPGGTYTDQSYFALRAGSERIFGW